jgi:hypothetical protein
MLFCVWQRDAALAASENYILLPDHAIIDQHWRESDPYKPGFIEVQQDEQITMTWDGLHILRSRYQQGQPTLTKLGWARFALFRDFCLPSVAAQTTDNFMWLIYTDPDLDPDLLDAMVDLLKPYPRFYLIKSLNNVLWTEGQAESLTNATIYTGNQALIENYMMMRNKVPVLETKLDADDALHRKYLATIQEQAVQKFYIEGVNWMYWCVKMELQWYWLGPKGETSDQKTYGILEVHDNVNFCPVPGLTVGYNVGVKTDTIYRRKHSVLLENLLKKDVDMCGLGKKGKDCVQIIDNFPFPAMRTRTPTSASMIMVRHKKKALLQMAANKNGDTMFELLAEDFGIKREDCARSSQHFSEKIIEIAEEALIGTCTGLFCNVSRRDAHYHTYLLRQLFART